MDSKSKKMILIALTAIVAVGAYVGYNYYRFVVAYNKTLTPEKAEAIIREKTSSVADGDIIPDEVTNNADATKGTSAQ
jgi:hypothetical protein